MERIGSTLPVQFAALGFLCERPMHGYELRTRLEEGLGSLWRIASSQLYNVLHRMEERGWVSSKLEPGERHASRTTYTATPAGLSELQAWLETPVQHLRDMRVEFFAKTYFLRRRSLRQVGELVDAQIALFQRREAGLTDGADIHSNDEAFAQAVASFRRRRIGNMIEWLQAMRDELMEREEDE